MTLEEATQRYIEKFGGYPYFLTMGMPDDRRLEVTLEALETGIEIKPKEGMIY